MNSERVLASVSASAGVATNDANMERARVRGRFDVEFFDRNGRLVWRKSVTNLVTVLGRNNMLDNHLSGSAYTAAWYLGLVDGASSPTFSQNDTMASHAGWAEFDDYDAATRPAPAFGAAAAGSKASSQVSFEINQNGAVAGCFLANNNTKGGTTGLLYSCGAFDDGDQPVTAGGELRVTYAAQLTT